MDDIAELALEGATAGIENFEKVYDPLKARVKNMHNPIRQFSTRRNDDRSGYRDEYDDDHDDRRGSRRESDRRGDPARGYVKETYYRESGRAKSAGRYGYNGEGRGRGTSKDGNFFFDQFHSPSSTLER